MKKRESPSPEKNQAQDSSRVVISNQAIIKEANQLISKKSVPNSKVISAFRVR